MLERFRTAKKEGKETRWSLFARKGADESAAPKAKAIKTVRSFCDPAANKACITICTPTGDCSCDAQPLRQALEEEIRRYGLGITIGKAKMGCGGRCKNGPLIGFPQKQFFYIGVKPEMAAEVVEETLVNGRLLFPLLSVQPNRSFRSDIYYEKDTGLLAAIDDTVCMVDVAKYFLDFEEGLSCGKCVPCRLGMKRMQETMERIVLGQGVAQDMEQIRMLCQTMVDVPHCDFAVTSSRPILSAMSYFEEEFLAHIERKECATGVCKELVEIQAKAAKLEKRKQKTKKKK
jgi:(2Fe-2S) ferredoxin